MKTVLKPNSMVIMIVITIGILINNSCGQEQLNAEEVFSLSKDALAKNNLYKYDYVYKFKGFDDKDTLIEKYKTILLRTPNDKVLNAQVKLQGVRQFENKEYHWEKIYNGREFLLIDHFSNKINKYDVISFGKNYIKKNFTNKQLPSFFTNNTFFQNYNEKGTDIKISDAIVENENVWKIEVLFPTNEDITFIQRVLYISKNNHLPVRVEGFAKYQDIQDEYFEYSINNLRVSQTRDTIFEKFYTLPEDYEFKVVDPPKKVNYSLLPNGAEIPSFEAINLDKGGLVVNNNSIKDKLILLDFWYLGCGPCLKTMPKLAEIYEKYRDDGFEIYGLNPYDSSAQIEVISAFAKKHNVNYKLLLIDLDVANDYLIKTYPSFYLIKNGKIIYSHVGSYKDNNGFTELDKIIAANLNRN